MIPKLSTKSSLQKSSAPIGVFDSGVGGLSVFRELKRLMPRERFVFLADQAHVPYGAKSPEQLRSLTSRITTFLLGHHCKIIVVACNTATCYAIEHLRETFSVPFVGTVPAIKSAVALTQTGVIGSISTPATAKSPALKKLIRQHAAHVRTIVVGCPGLEDLVETGGITSVRVLELLKKYLRSIIAANADTLVLGCTHYPFLKSSIRKVAPKLRTVDSGRAVARRTKALLSDLNLLRSSGRGTMRLYTTGDPIFLSSVASTLLKRRVKATKARI